jgi:4'-phosphopantetheinyl transferase
MRETFFFQNLDNSVSWLAPPELILLKNNEVHVWRASLEMTPYQVKTLEQLLSADEMDKAERFHFQKDRDHFIAARGILRSILGRYLKMNPDKLKIYYGPYGKPALDEKTHGKSLRFNASHSHGLALFSFALDREIGVDLEYIRSDLSDGNIAAQFFSQREAVALNALPENVRQKAFFTLWTRKEAYLKAQGRGLSGDLKQLEVFPSLGYPSEFPEINGSSQEESPWLLMDLAVLPEYAAALAVEGHDLQFKFWQWEYA